MFEEIKSIDFSGEMKTNDLYYLFKTDSSQINLEILSKLQKYTSQGEFCKHYIGKDLNTINDFYDNFINKISAFSIQNKKKNLIQILTNIYLISPTYINF
jgi:hypothetical protein